MSPSISHGNLFQSPERADGIFWWGQVVYPD
jgi:hypothetical protein